jgi:hypothetical protein
MFIEELKKRKVKRKVRRRRKARNNLILLSLL